MNNFSSEKIGILKEKGMETDELNFSQLEFIYDVVINGENLNNKENTNKYKKISWNGNNQLNYFLNIINNYKNCKSIKKNDNFTILNIYSFLDYSNQIFIHSKPKIILKKIKKRCDFILTSNRWLQNIEDFKQINKNKFIWLQDIEDENSTIRLKEICSLVLNDNVDLKKDIENGIF